LQKSSTLPGMPGGQSNYNANDQLSTGTYDANGNTTASHGNGYAHDFENHLVQQAGITIVYDGLLSLGTLAAATLFRLPTVPDNPCCILS